MTRPVVLVTHSGLAEEAKAILAAAHAEVVYMRDAITEDVLASRLANEGINAVLMRGSPPLTRRVLEGAKQLKMVAKHGAGIDSVDIDAATERGIVLVTAGGANADAVAEHTLAMMLSLARDLPRLDRELRNGIWPKTHYVGHEFRGRVVGIVGYGAIGRRVARLSKAFGARIAVHSRTAGTDADGAQVYASLDDMLPEVDVLSLHCPMTPQTRGLIGERQLRLMKPSALLINTARGRVIDDAALLQALTNGTIAGAALDVFTEEPTPSDNPLLRLPNVISTPHIAALTQESLIRLGTVSASQIVDYLRDGTLVRENVVNTAVLG